MCKKGIRSCPRRVYSKFLTLPQASSKSFLYKAMAMACLPALTLQIGIMFVSPKILRSMFHVIGPGRGEQQTPLEERVPPLAALRSDAQKMCSGSIGSKLISVPCNYSAHVLSTDGAKVSETEQGEVSRRRSKGWRCWSRLSSVIISVPYFRKSFLKHDKCST